MNEKTTGSFFILIQKRKKEEKIMLKYILKRLGLGIVTLFVLITITFFLTRLMPGNPFSSDNISATALAQLNSKYGLDKPLDQQYLLYMKNLLHGDLGVSYKKTGVSVNTIIAQGLPNTVSLGLSAFVFSLIVGVAMGIWMAATKKEWVRGILLTGTTLGVSIPNFVFAAGLMINLCIWSVPKSSANKYLPSGVIRTQCRCGFSCRSLSSTSSICLPLKSESAAGRILSSAPACF